MFIFSAFYSIISDAWKDNPDFSLYLAELSASSVEKLSKTFYAHYYPSSLRDLYWIPFLSIHLSDWFTYPDLEMRLLEADKCVKLFLQLILLEIFYTALSDNWGWENSRREERKIVANPLKQHYKKEAKREIFGRNILI